jgi:hypothetical protein
MSNQVLDNEVQFEFYTVLKKTRIKLCLFSFIYISFSLIFLYTQDLLDYTLISLLFWPFGLKFANLSAYNQVYHYKIENSSLILFILNPWGKKGSKSFSKNNIIKSTLHSTFLVKDYGVTFETKIKKSFFKLNGEFVMKELIPLLKEEWIIDSTIKEN